MATRSVALVEDDRLVADMYRLGLQQRGFKVTIHTDGAAFLKTVVAELPDVVVLDWHLGAVTGEEVLSRLRGRKQTQSLPVLILSNVTRRDDTQEVTSRLGAVAWLEKMSTPPARLADVVTAVFESANSRATAPQT